MIEYWQGFEIDGSDTSYNLVVPEREKCIDLLRYYFKLKVIHKGKPVKIYRARGKGTGELVNQVFMPENMEDLWDIIRSYDLKFLELEYTYVAPNSLYPEVKRELIDMLMKQSGIKHTFVKPMFPERYYIVSYISVDFDSKPSPHHYEMACSESYYAVVSKNSPFLNVIFDCSLNGPYELMFYGLSKIKDAFPEFEIDMHLNEDLLCYYDVKWDELIKEGIPVESTDYVFTLERILSYPAVMLNQDDNKQIHLRRLPGGIKNFDPLKIYINEKSPADAGGWTKDEVNWYTALKGIMGKSTFSITEYVEKVQKLARAEIFSDADFENYTSFDFTIQIDKDSTQYCTIKYVRTSTDPEMIMLVPYKHRDRIMKLLNL
ncbi:MAG: hypothetical protein LBV72_01580 [Tannerella sp.]|jgi:hypothetical protein|nr:hypothetical protein [Tannerella sp.]